jgi:hypothetical protein
MAITAVPAHASDDDDIKAKVLSLWKGDNPKSAENRMFFLYCNETEGKSAAECFKLTTYYSMARACEKKRVEGDSPDLPAEVKKLTDDVCEKVPPVPGVYNKYAAAAPPPPPSYTPPPAPVYRAPPPPPAPPVPQLASHNGSLMKVESLGSGQIVISYADPKPSLRPLVGPGSVLLRGTWDFKAMPAVLRATAVVFTNSCGPIPYAVEGSMTPEGVLTLIGAAPVVNPGTCVTTGYTWASPNASLVFIPRTKS